MTKSEVGITLLVSSKKEAFYWQDVSCKELGIDVADPEHGLAEAAYQWCWKHDLIAYTGVPIHRAAAWMWISDHHPNRFYERPLKSLRRHLPQEIRAFQRQINTDEPVKVVRNVHRSSKIDYSKLAW